MRGLGLHTLGVIPSLPNRALADAAYERALKTIWRTEALIRSGILNAELNHAIASMGHGDLMIVCDAGFPIPSSAWRIDLAVVPDVPDLETVLLPISRTLIVERIGFADVLPEYNAPLLSKVKRLFPSGHRAGQARTPAYRDGREGEGYRAHRRARIPGATSSFIPASTSAPISPSPALLRRIITRKS